MADDGVKEGRKSHARDGAHEQGTQHQFVLDADLGTAAAQEIDAEGDEEDAGQHVRPHVASLRVDAEDALETVAPGGQ